MLLEVEVRSRNALFALLAFLRENGALEADGEVYRVVTVWPDATGQAVLDAARRRVRELEDRLGLPAHERWATARVIGAGE